MTTPYLATHKYVGGIWRVSGLHNSPKGKLADCELLNGEFELDINKVFYVDNLEELSEFRLKGARIKTLTAHGFVDYICTSVPEITIKNFAGVHLEDTHIENILFITSEKFPYKPKKQQQPMPTNPTDQLVDYIKQQVLDQLNGSKQVDEQTIKKLVEEYSDEEIKKHFVPTLHETIRKERVSILEELDKKLKNNLTAREIKVTHTDEPAKTIDVGQQHKCFAKLVKFLSLNIPVYIHGPTGSFKTSATEKAAEALELPFYRKVMGQYTTETQIMGYGTATGEYIPGIAYKPYTEGGVLLIDEIDNGNPNVNVCLKMLSDSNKCFFPVKGVLNKHPNFKLVANANTTGHGPNSQYRSRLVQDGALLNIFAILHWPYDEPLETEIAKAEYKIWKGYNEKLRDKFITEFHRTRKIIEELKYDHCIISPRNLFQAMRMLATEVDIPTIRDTVVLRSLSNDQRDTVINKLKEKQDPVEEIIEDALEVSPF